MAVDYTGKKFIVGIFNHEDEVLSGITQVKSKGLKIFDVFSPFPVHGIDDVLDIKRSRLPIAAFLFGMTGTSLALLMQSYMLGWDWPMDIGGKPNFAFPSFVPVVFEVTVLLAAFGMVGTFFASTHLAPGIKNIILDLRATDDKFVMAIDPEANSMSEAEIQQLLQSAGASEVNYAEDISSKGYEEVKA